MTQCTTAVRADTTRCSGPSYGGRTVLARPTSGNRGANTGRPASTRIEANKNGVNKNIAATLRRRAERNY